MPGDGLRGVTRRQRLHPIFLSKACLEVKPTGPPGRVTLRFKMISNFLRLYNKRVHPQHRVRNTINLFHSKRSIILKRLIRFAECFEYQRLHINHVWFYFGKQFYFNFLLIFYSLNM
jgi:hypothetical protein